MKIHCDVCEKEEAAVYCTADEAALCDGCDHRVHHANKLASKHLRFSLLLPDPKTFPLCDLCQEKRGIVFCQQDRAILCQDCDIPIHGANEFTLQHSRFLLTGVKLSPTSQLYISPTTHHAAADPAGANLADVVPCITASTPKSLKKTLPEIENPNHHVGQGPADNSSFVNSLSSSSSSSSHKYIPTTINNNTSSISDYLIDMVPGWHVDDFLPTPPSSSSAAFAFSQGGGNLMSPFSCENSGIWVPQTPTDHQYFPSHHHNQQQQQLMMGIQQNETKNNQYYTSNNTSNKGNNNNNRRWTMDDVFAVPQISPPSSASKRSRLLWQ